MNVYRVQNDLKDGLSVMKSLASSNSREREVLLALMKKHKWDIYLPTDVQFLSHLLVCECFGQSMDLYSYKMENMEGWFFQGVQKELQAGLEWLHSVGWMHLDVHPGNVLVKVNGQVVQVKLTDLECALPEGELLFKEAGVMGRPVFSYTFFLTKQQYTEVTPEMKEKQKCRPSCDIIGDFFVMVWMVNKEFCDHPSHARQLQFVKKNGVLARKADYTWKEVNGVSWDDVKAVKLT